MEKLTTFLCLSVMCFVLTSGADDLATGSVETTTYPSPFCSDEITEQCPPVDGEDPVYFPNPEDCGSFCECSDGYAYLIHCQDGTYWDPENNVCNFENNVDCGDRPTPPSV